MLGLLSLLRLRSLLSLPGLLSLLSLPRQLSLLSLLSLLILSSPVSLLLNPLSFLSPESCGRVPSAPGVFGQKNW